jgi:arabinan endo-1,5-alpha-L-arabinosidase
LSFGSFWNGLYIVQLDKSGKAPVGRIKHIAGRSGGAIEAPFIVRRDKWYYLFVSFDNCCKGAESTYKVMVGRSKEVDGPYLDFSNKDMVSGGGTLLLASYKNIRGPGHNAVLTGKGASYLIHHFYDANNSGRATLQIRPMLWASDDWPVVGEPGIPDASMRPKAKVNMSGTYEHSVDYGKHNPVHLLANGKINREDGSATWLCENGLLQLRWPRSDAPRGVWRDECFVAHDGKWYVGRNEQGMIVRGLRIAGKR